MVSRKRTQSFFAKDSKVLICLRALRDKYSLCTLGEKGNVLTQRTQSFFAKDSKVLTCLRALRDKYSLRSLREIISLCSFS